MEVVDEDSVARFIGVAGCRPDEARFFLEAAGGNFDRGVSMFFGEAPSAIVA